MSDYTPSANPAIGWTDEHGEHHHAPGHEPKALDDFEYTLTRRALRQIRAEAYDAGLSAAEAMVDERAKQIAEEYYYAGHRSACDFTENLCREVHADHGGRS